MKKLVCALLLVGTTVGLHAKEPNLPPPGHRQRPATLPERDPKGPHARGFVEVTLNDLQVTETELLAKIGTDYVPVRMVRIGKQGKVFVKPVNLRTISCQQCQHNFTVDNRENKPTCPQCNAKNKKSND